MIFVWLQSKKRESKSNVVLNIILPSRLYQSIEFWVYNTPSPSKCNILDGLQSGGDVMQGNFPFVNF